MSKHRHHETQGSAMVGRSLIGLTLLAGTLILIRALPDLVRYMRVRRM
jgi:hypothetical protein